MSACAGRWNRGSRSSSFGIWEKYLHRRVNKNAQGQFDANASRSGSLEFWLANGYGVFSVSASAKEPLVAYIANQEMHHRTMSFQEELRAILTRHGVAFDERYLWD